MLIAAVGFEIDNLGVGSVEMGLGSWDAKMRGRETWEVVGRLLQLEILSRGISPKTAKTTILIQNSLNGKK